MQADEKSSHSGLGQSERVDQTQHQGRLAWLESMVDSRHWPSLRILFTGNLLTPIMLLGGSVLFCLVLALSLIHI